MSNWKSGIVEWTLGEHANLSVVFSWQLPKAYQRAVWYRELGYRVHAGGPAVTLNPNYLKKVAHVIGGNIPDVVALHNPDATFTSRGCPRKCKFCAVPGMEGELVELDYWPVRPIVCDNNLLATSKAHFDRVIDRLKPLNGVDFNQGLDARLLTDYHAERLRELDLKCVRLAWDHTSLEREFMEAFETLTTARFPARKIRVYVLIGWKDTPEDALYRLETVRDLGAFPNPMRYQPLDIQSKNGYVAPSWTDRKLKIYMRYWSNIFHLNYLPFDQYIHGVPSKNDNNQLKLEEK